MASAEEHAALGQEEIIVQLQAKKMTELKKMLKERNLPLSGKKDDIIQRLLPFIAQEQEQLIEPTGNSSDVDVDVEDVGDDLLDEDDGDGVDETEMDADEEALLGDSSLGDEVEEQKVVAEPPPPPEPDTRVKELNLGKRSATTAQTTITTTNESVDTVEGVVTEAEVGGESAGKQPRLLTKEERAARFGTSNTSTNAAGVQPRLLTKEERAARFGTSNTSTNTAGVLSKEDRAKKFDLGNDFTIKSSSTAPAGVLSKEERAKKFGIESSNEVAPVSTKLGSLSKEERAKKFGDKNKPADELELFGAEAKARRLEKFGLDKTVAVTNGESQDLKSKRAERFQDAAEPKTGPAAWKSTANYSSMTEDEKRRLRSEKFQ